VTLDDSWVPDHGTWSVLRHVYPHADVPIVQLSLDETRPPSFHYEIGRRLAPLRAEGVLIVGSGNIVHNLLAYAWGRHMPDPYDWAVRFENEAKGLLVTGEHKPLVDYIAGSRGAAVDSHAGSLPSAVVRDRHSPTGRLDYLPG
jgi:4,5-DOPA dioxygenase extradiol